MSEGYPISPVLSPAQILAALATVAGAFGYNVLTKTTCAAGSLIYGGASNAVSELAIGAANTVLTSSGAAPQWSTSLALGGSFTVSGQSGLGGGGTNATAAVATQGVAGLTGVSIHGYLMAPTFPSTTTTTASGFRTALATAAAAFTLTTMINFAGVAQTLGAGSAVTNGIGFYSSTLIGTNEIDFYAGTGLPTGVWCFYNDKGIKNYLGTAATLINTTTDDGVNKLQVNGGLTATKHGAGISPAAFFHASGDMAVIDPLRLTNTNGVNPSDYGIGPGVGAAASFNIYHYTSALPRFQIANADGLMTALGKDATTATVVSQFILDRQSTGTPANGFGEQLLFKLQSSTIVSRSAGAISVEWANATDASRTGRMKLVAVDTTAREGMRVEASGSAPLISFFGATAVAQQALTVDPVNALINYGLLAAGAGLVKTWRKILTGINVNSAATDVGTFSNLPAKYRVIRLEAFDASVSLTTATADLRTAAGGGGTALVAAAGMAACTAAAKFSDLTLAAIATTDYQTAATLTVRNVTAQGAPATVSFLLEVIDLT
jgi:hypothetical protein